MQTHLSSSVALTFFFFLETFHLCFECLVDRWFSFRSSSSQRLILILVFTTFVAKIFLCVVCQLPLAWPHGSKYFCKDPRCFLFEFFSPLNEDTFSCRADTLWFPVGSVWISLLSRGSTHTEQNGEECLPGNLLPRQWLTGILVGRTPEQCLKSLIPTCARVSWFSLSFSTTLGVVINGNSSSTRVPMARQYARSRGFFACSSLVRNGA